MIRENLTHTRQNMEDACRRAGRDAGDVTLIAVSKKNMKPFPGISAGI